MNLTFLIVREAHIATIISAAEGELAVNIITDANDAHRFLQKCKSDCPEEGGLHVCHYARTGETVLLNLKIERLNMDILNQLELNRNTRAVSKPEKPRIMIAPNPDVLPEDGMLEYIVVSNLTDIASATAGAVLLFGSSAEDKQMLRVFMDFPDLFPFYPILLDGLPKADYSVDFESIAWKCEHVSYHNVIGDVVEASRSTAARKEETRTTSEREQTRRTTKSGVIRPFTKFDVHNVEVTRRPGVKPQRQEVPVTPDAELGIDDHE